MTPLYWKTVLKKKSLTVHYRRYFVTVTPSGRVLAEVLRGRLAHIILIRQV